MKTLVTTFAALSVMALVSGNVMAEGSKMKNHGEGSRIKNSLIFNASKNKDTVTLAEGRNSEATTGSISIANSRIKDSKVINFSKNKGTTTHALGENSEAHTGSINIQ